MKITHDWLGPLELPTHPRRIISLAPNITDTLFALGLGSRVVGRSAFCYRPDETKALPVVSSYTRVRMELLKSLQPDLVLISTGVQRDLLNQLFLQGLPIFPIPLPQSPYGILENIGVLGELMGVGERASLLCAELGERYAQMHQILPPMTFYLEFDLGGPITIGRGSYVGEALRHLGLVNIYADYPQSYFQPDLEYVRREEPNFVIYEPKPHRSNQPERVRGLMASRHWEYPLVMTNGDELAHYGPKFFEYLDSVERQIEQLEA